MNNFNLELLHGARRVRTNLRWSRIPEYRNASIRDAVEMAADLMRQLAHEDRENCEAA